MPIAGLRVPPRTLHLEQSPSSFSSSYHEQHRLDVMYPNGTPELEHETYETFLACLTLNETGSLTGNGESRHISSIQHWRSDIESNEYGPPKSPMNVDEFPASPVASVDPAQLQITSSPPFQLPFDSGSSSTLDEDDLVYIDAVVYDASSDSSSSLDLGEHVILPSTTRRVKEKQPKRSFSVLSQLANKTVWLPRRLKYSWLSFAQRVSPSRKV